MSEGYDAEAEARAIYREAMEHGLTGPSDDMLAALIRKHRAAGRREGIARLDAVRALVERLKTALDMDFRNDADRILDELETALGAAVREHEGSEE